MQESTSPHESSPAPLIVHGSPTPLCTTTRSGPVRESALPSDRAPEVSPEQPTAAVTVTRPRRSIAHERVCLAVIVFRRRRTAGVAGEVRAAADAVRLALRVAFEVARVAGDQFCAHRTAIAAAAVPTAGAAGAAIA